MHIIDLSYTLTEGMPHHPMHPRAPVVLSGTLAHEMTERWMGEHPELGRVSFVNEQIVLSGHTGTHMDAPLHAGRELADAADLDLACCIGPATCLDLSTHCGPRVVLSADDLRAALPDGETLRPIVLLHTGWSAMHDQDANRYYRHSMGLTEDAALYLRDAGVRCVGIDAPSIDAPHTPGAPAHMHFLRGEPEVYVIENLRGLDQLPVQVPFFSAAPLPIARSSGSPVRAYAVLGSVTVTTADASPAGLPVVAAP
ncbi:cyclase family protein [Rhodococcus sp. NPDC057529]|uniref:cyclase family protein n=1 Tax=Rhodococcus sp. NPDC057529 TaxID=3346158 RepID=UPI00366AED18